jgi:hypothetical protein
MLVQLTGFCVLPNFILCFPVYNFRHTKENGLKGGPSGLIALLKSTDALFLVGVIKKLSVCHKSGNKLVRLFKFKLV